MIPNHGRIASVRLFLDDQDLSRTYGNEDLPVYHRNKQKTEIVPKTSMSLIFNSLNLEKDFLVSENNNV